MSVSEYAAMIVVLLAIYGWAHIACDVLRWVVGNLSRRRKP